MNSKDFFIKNFASNIYITSKNSRAQGSIVGYTNDCQKIVIGLNFYTRNLRVKQVVPESFYVKGIHDFFYLIPVKEIKTINNEFVWKKR